MGYDQSTCVTNQSYEAWKTYCSFADLNGASPGDKEKTQVEDAIFKGSCTKIMGNILVGCAPSKKAIQDRGEVQAVVKDLRALVGKGHEKDFMPMVFVWPRRRAP